MSYGFGKLNEYAERAHRNACDKGFWDHKVLDVHDVEIVNPSICGEKLMLIVTEVAEVIEARRDGDETAEADEVADIIIRCLDYAEARGFNIEQHVVNILTKNEQRPHQHGRGLG